MAQTWARDMARGVDESFETWMLELLRRQPADHVEARLEVSQALLLDRAGTRPPRIEWQEAVGGNVRATCRGFSAFIHFDGWDGVESAVSEAVRLAAVAAALGGQGAAPWAEATAVRGRFPVDFAEDPAGVPVEEKIRLLDGFAELARAQDRQVAAVQWRYFDRLRQLWLFTSAGTAIAQEKLDLGGAVVAVARGMGQTAQRGASFGSSNDFGALRRLGPAVEEAARTAVRMLDAEAIEPGEYTVVCDPELTGVFTHEAFGHLSEADGQVHDAWLLQELRIGRRFAIPELHIYDTGRDLGTRGFLPIDDEGTPARDVDLIREGVLVGRLHSRRTAGIMGDPPTGNGRAINYRHPPIVRMRNTVMAGGSTAPEDLLRGIRRGIYAKGSSGGQTNGEMFTFRAAEAYRIADGRITGPLRNAVLTGNVFSTLGQITAIGRDFTRYEGGGGCGKAGQMPLPVSHHAPSLRIERCLVGG